MKFSHQKTCICQKFLVTLWPICTHALTRIYDEISDRKIIMAIKENPKITRAELQNITGLSESGVKKILC